MNLDVEIELTLKNAGIFEMNEDFEWTGSVPSVVEDLQRSTNIFMEHEYSPALGEPTNALVVWLRQAGFAIHNSVVRLHPEPDDEVVQ